MLRSCVHVLSYGCIGALQAVERRGVGAMELVAMDMKLRGMYIARQLSFQGVSFNIEDIPVPKQSIKIYNEAVKLVSDAKQVADILYFLFSGNFASRILISECTTYHTTTAEYYAFTHFYD